MVERENVLYSKQSQDGVYPILQDGAQSTWREVWKHHILNRVSMVWPSLCLPPSASLPLPLSLCLSPSATSDHHVYRTTMLNIHDSTNALWCKTHQLHTKHGSTSCSYSICVCILFMIINSYSHNTFGHLCLCCSIQWYCLYWKRKGWQLGSCKLPTYTHGTSLMQQLTCQHSDHNCCITIHIVLCFSIIKKTVIVITIAWPIHSY